MFQKVESNKIVEKNYIKENTIWLFSQDYLVIIPEIKNSFNKNTLFNLSEFFYRRTNKPFNIRFNEDYIEVDRRDQKKLISEYLKESNSREISRFVNFIKNSSNLYISQILLKRKKLKSLEGYIIERNNMPLENKYYHFYSCCVFEEKNL